MEAARTKLCRDWVREKMSAGGSMDPFKVESDFYNESNASNESWSVSIFR